MTLTKCWWLARIDLSILISLRIKRGQWQPMLAPDNRIAIKNGTKSTSIHRLPLPKNSNRETAPHSSLPTLWPRQTWWTSEQMDYSSQLKASTPSHLLLYQNSVLIISVRFEPTTTPRKLILMRALPSHQHHSTIMNPNKPPSCSERAPSQEVDSPRRPASNRAWRCCPMWAHTVAKRASEESWSPMDLSHWDNKVASGGPHSEE